VGEERDSRRSFDGYASGVTALLLTIAVLFVLLAGCGDGGSGDRSAGPRIDDPGPVHVHGLGVNPKDGALFIATHTGLFRAPKNQQKAVRVADRYQDTMGFSVAGPDRFLGSGHPDFKKDPDLPPLLGLIESTDAGQTWEPISLLGQADFHVLEATGRRVFGFDSSGGRLLASRDGGKTWRRRLAPEPLVSLAINPRDARQVIASGERALYVSRDEGRRWRRIAPAAGLLAWPEPERVYLIAGDGSVSRGNNATRAWRRVGNIGGQPAAFESEGKTELYAALHDGTVKRSTDGGESWGVRSRP
jgi:hypothetical protein